MPELGTTHWVLGQSVDIVCRDGVSGVTGVLGIGAAASLPVQLGFGSCATVFDPTAWVGIHQTTLGDWTLTIQLPNVPLLAGVDLTNGLRARIGY